MAEQAKVIKKKVRPYPIEATLDPSGQKRQVEIIHLNTLGVIVRLKASMLFVGEYYQMYFEIPVTRESINVQTRVLKTYDKSVDPKAGLVERLAELHFQGLTSEHKSRIVAFMASIGQDK